MSESEPAKPVILVADDEPAIRLVIVRKLECAGWHVIATGNGEDAFKLASEALPRLIITDYQMPRADGMQMARRLFAQASTRAIPVILLTARGHRIGGDDFDDTNIQHVLMKPFSMRQVVGLAQDYRDAPPGCADRRNAA